MYLERYPIYPKINKPSPVILRVWEGDYGVPSIDPSSLIALTIVKIFKVNADIKTAYFPFIADIPSICVNNFFTDDKTKLLKRIFKMCEYELNFTFNQHVKLDAYKNYFFENFAEPFYFDCWIHETNYRHAIETWFTNVIPFPFSVIYLNKHRTEAQKAFVIYTPKWNYDSYMTKKYEDAAICLGDFNYLLKDGRKFIYKNIPTSLDAIVYSHLTIAMHIPLHNCTLQTLIYRHRWLVSYVNRITEEYFPKTSTEFKYVEPIYGSYKRISNKYLVISGICAATIMFLYAYSCNFIQFKYFKICFHQPKVEVSKIIQIL